MKRFVLALLCTCSVFQAFSQAGMPLSERLKWWQDSKMGLFIHWGPVSLTGNEISWSRKDYGAARYDSLYKRFNPKKFNAKEWVDLAKSSGMEIRISVMAASEQIASIFGGFRKTKPPAASSPFSGSGILYWAR